MKKVIYRQIHNRTVLVGKVDNLVQILHLRADQCSKSRGKSGISRLVIAGKIGTPHTMHVTGIGGVQSD